MNSVSAAGMSMSLMRVQIIHYFVDNSDRLVRRVFGVQSKRIYRQRRRRASRHARFQVYLETRQRGHDFRAAEKADRIIRSQSRADDRPSLSVETAYPLTHSNQKEQVDGITQIGVRNIQFLEAPVPMDSAGNTDLPNTGPTPVITPVPPPPPPPTPPTPTPVPTPRPSITPTPRSDSGRLARADAHQDADTRSDQNADAAPADADARQNTDTGTGRGIGRKVKSKK